MATRTKAKPKPKPDPYQLVAQCSGRAPGYVDMLRDLGALDGLTPADAKRVGEHIGDLLGFYGRWGNHAVDDPRCAEQLYNRSVNAPARADGIGWDDPDAVGRAFAAAKTALTPKLPEVDPTC